MKQPKRKAREGRENPPFFFRVTYELVAPAESLPQGGWAPKADQESRQKDALKILLAINLTEAH